jgi:hypothetical protein
LIAATKFATVQAAVQAISTSQAAAGIALNVNVTQLITTVSFAVGFAAIHNETECGTF